MPFTMPRSTAQMTGCSMAAGAERAVVVDDAQLVAALLGVGGEAVGGEGVGHGVQRGAERALPVGAPPSAGGHGPAVLDADLLGHRLGVGRRQAGQRPAEQGEDEVVGLHRHRQRHLLLVGPVVLRRPTGPAALAALDGHVEVAAGGQLVEVVAGHVGVEAELLGHLRRRDAPLVLVGEEVDLPPGRVAEGVGDGRHRGRERPRCEAGGGWRRLHARYSTYLRSGNPLEEPPPMPPSSDQVVDALRPVQDPELHRSIVDLGMVRDVAVEPAGPGRRHRRPHRGRLPAAQRDPAPGHRRRRRPRRRARRRPRLHRDDRRGADGPAPAAARRPVGHRRPGARPTATPRAARSPSPKPGSRTRPLLISSGKGGVGKSSVTTNLAVALAQRGHSVGVLDADVYGFSIPRMLGADRDPVVIDEMLLPPEAWGVRCISMAYFVPDGQAVIWRGPMLHKALEQFLTDVYWDDPDFLLVDMPPGTGDIAISLSQYLPRAEVYVVTTPQPAAQQVARLSAAMAEKVHLEVKGVIENMSWFTGDDGTRYELFGGGGGQELADELGVPLLGQIPLLPHAARGRRRGQADHRRRARQRGRPGLPRAGRADRRRAEAEEGLPARAHDPLSRAARRSRRRPTASDGGARAAVAAVGGPVVVGAVGWWRRRRPVVGGGRGRRRAVVGGSVGGAVGGGGVVGGAVAGGASAGRSAARRRIRGRRVGGRRVGDLGLGGRRS